MKSFLRQHPQSYHKFGIYHFSSYSYQIQGIAFDFSLPSPFPFICRFFFSFKVS